MSDEKGRRDLVPPPAPEVKKLEDLIGQLSLPSEQRGRLRAEVRATFKLLYHRGPLPSPQQYAEYGVVLDSAPERILAMAEKQQDHDLAFDKSILSSESNYRILTLVASFLVIGGMIAGAVVCAVTGHEAAAAALGGGAGLSALAGLFIKGRNLLGIQTAPDQSKQLPPPPPAKKGRGS